MKVASEASLCYIDIDKPKIQLPEEMVSFPHEQAFIDELWSALDKHGISVPNTDLTRSWHVSVANIKVIFLCDYSKYNYKFFNKI